MKVVVLYESRTGNTRHAGELIGGAARDVGAEVAVRPVSAYDPHELAAADAVFIGTWTDGFVVAGMRPGGMRNLRKLPVIERKPTGVFVTYAVNSGRALSKLAGLVETEKGGHVVGGAMFRRGKEWSPGVVELVDNVLAAVPADA